MLNLPVAQTLLLIPTRSEQMKSSNIRLLHPLNAYYTFSHCVQNQQNRNGEFSSQHERTTVERHLIRFARIADNSPNVSAVVTRHGSQSQPKTS